MTDVLSRIRVMVEDDYGIVTLSGGVGGSQGGNTGQGLVQVTQSVLPFLGLVTLGGGNCQGWQDQG